MTDSEVLRGLINERGIKYKFIAKKLGITPYCLQKKIDNQSDFKGKEIAELSNILSLSAAQRDQIFLRLM